VENDTQSTTFVSLRSKYTHGGSLLKVHELPCYVIASWGYPLAFTSRSFVQIRYHFRFITFKIHTWRFSVKSTRAAVLCSSFMGTPLRLRRGLSYRFDTTFVSFRSKYIQGRPRIPLFD
jgi:hypothetical protein